MITLTGVLTDVGGNPIPKGLISFVSTRNCGESLNHAEINQRADANGNYAFKIKVGEYDVYAQVSRQSDVEPLGTCSVTSDLSGEMSLEDVMAINEPVLPASVIEVSKSLKECREIKETVTTLEESVQEKSETVSESAETVAQDKEVVTAALAKVQEAEESIATASQAVTDKAETVNSQYGEISEIYPDIKSKHQSITELSAQVTTLYDEVQEAAKTVSENAGLVQTAKSEIDVTASTVKEQADSVSDALVTIEADTKEVSDKHAEVLEKAKIISDAEAAITPLASQVSKDAKVATDSLAAIETLSESVTNNAAQVASDTKDVKTLHDEVQATAKTVSENATDAASSSVSAQASAETAKKAEEQAELLVSSATGGALLKDANLSDLPDINTALSNIGGVSDDDSRLSDSREWSASLVTTDEIETGSDTTAKKWSVSLVMAANAQWWAKSDAKTELSGKLVKTSNLSDLDSATEARQNLSVYSQTQVNNRLDKCVLKTTKICGKELSGDVDLTPADLGIDNTSDAEMHRRLRINSLIGESILPIK
ncbi:hypothetical protein [Vibrio quintilis]|uniref:Chromosome segregation protein n=1 Tax=Vibrio quintilis TaxID=1117707 RepID=A0A1M7YP52_9VIBR|nr:hypothetical protein [Vibrio quintilis]SHO54410.1 chromosome segregation protein [Vibrio quintilis]